MNHRKLLQIATASSLLITQLNSQLPAAPGDVTLGGEVILRFRADAGGKSPEQRADAGNDRLVRLVSVPDITPAAVAVYTPWNQAPVIYVLGRKLITVDKATAAASGIGTPLDAATKWAAHLQQILPRVDVRLPNEPEPVVPADPPLTVTSNFTQLGGDPGEVILRDKLVMRLHGPQPKGMTPMERADNISAALAKALHADSSLTPADIRVDSLPPGRKIDSAFVGPPPQKVAPPVVLMIGARPIVAVDYATADAAGVKSPRLLAEGWAKNIRAAAFPPPKPAPPATVVPPATPAPAPPATITPAAPSTPAPSVPPI